MARDKGKRGELEVAKELTSRLGVEHIRSAQRNGKHTSDVIVADDEDGYGVHWEVKRQERLNLWEAMEQAEFDRKKDDIPAVAHRKNNTEWMVTFLLEDIVEFCRLIEYVRNKD